MSNAVEILERAIIECSDVACCHRALSQALAALRGPEPDWSEAPEWAQWWAVGTHGYARWYSGAEKPAPALAAWVTRSDMFTHAGRVDLPLGTDWRLTLRQRPRGEKG